MRAHLAEVSRDIVVLLFVGSAAATAGAQQQQAARPPRAAVEEFVFGDWYAIDVERAGLRRRFGGELVKVTDKWIVLRVESEGRNDYAVPVLSKIPYINRSFRNVSIGREIHCLWVPREAADIAGHIRPEVARPVAAIEEQAPPTGHACTATHVVDGKIVETAGELTAATDRAVAVTFERGVSERRKVPMLGELPLVGSAFRRTENKSYFVREDLPLENVLCVRTGEGPSVQATLELVREDDSVTTR